MRPTGWARKGIVGGYIAAIGAASAAGVVFACTSVSGAWIAVQPPHGLAGSVATISGGNWDPGTVTLNWYSGASSFISTFGPVAASGGAFDTNVTIPATASPGTYYIGGVEGSKTASTAFTVDQPTVQPTGTASNTTGTGSGGYQPVPPGSGTQSGTVSAPVGSSTGGTVESGPNGGTPGSIPSGSDNPPGSSTAPNGGPPSGSSATAGADGPAWATSTVPVGSTGSTSGFTPSRSGSNASAVPGRVPTLVPSPAQRGSQGSLNSGLWGGFGKAPATLGGLFSAGAPDGQVSEFGVGIGLATVALIAMAGGFGAAELRARSVRHRA